MTTELSSPLPRPGLVPVIESDDALAPRLEDLSGLDKLRLLGSADDKLRLHAHNTGLWVDDITVVAHPTLETLRWVREQALSETRHRHGSLTGRHPGLLDR